MNDLFVDFNLNIYHTDFFFFKAVLKYRERAAQSVHPLNTDLLPHFLSVAYGWETGCTCNYFLKLNVHVFEKRLVLLQFKFDGVLEGRVLEYFTEHDTAVSVGITCRGLAQLNYLGIVLDSALTSPSQE